ncbi:MAG: tRNA 2-selenouridine(34) synthase MnmH [Pseudomonadota bacterium]
MRADAQDFDRIFLEDTPLIDTRAPIEFAKGAVPGAHNLPLMSDDERAAVGTCYKQRGQDAAVALGHELVSGNVRAERLEAWRGFAERHPNGFLYCFRGGMRSEIVQRWLSDAGCPYPRIPGGYKALRQYLLQVLEERFAKDEYWIVSGATGSGKTRLINQLQRSVDLEGLAKHRGSAFGNLLQAQPSQIDFENQLAVSLLKLSRHAGPVILEDEGRLIGRLNLPEGLRKRMQSAPLLVLEYPLEDRVQIVLEDYIKDLGDRYREAHGAEGPGLHWQRLRDDLARTRKRLGLERHAEILEQMDHAFRTQQRDSGDSGIEAHRVWIRRLLVEYYDPMYRYQLEKRQGQRLHSGTREQVKDFVLASAS